MATHSHKLIQQALKAHMSGQLDAATALYAQVLAQEPDNFDALHLSGAAALQRGDAANAVTWIEKALAQSQPAGTQAEQRKRLGDAYNNLGVSLQQLRRFDESLVAFRNALQHRAGDADLEANTGMLAKELGEYEVAESHLRRAIAIKPQHVRALVGMALVEQITSRLDAAEITINRALQVAPNEPAALTLRGNLLVARGDTESALRSFDAAIAHQADFADAYYNRALLYLALGRLGEAWPDLDRYHPMRRGQGFKPLQKFPADMRGRHVMVNRNQGVGDELFFLRFMPLLKARGAKISYRTEERMLSFARRIDAIDELMSEEVKSFRADHVVLMDHLPHLLGLGDADVPRALPMAANGESLRRMALRLQQAGPPPYLAVTWRAGRMRSEVNFRKERTEILFKEISPEELAVPLRQWPGTVLIVQRNPAADEMQRFQSGLGRAAQDFTDVNADLEDMLALMSLIERYVTVSNANLHLRAAAGLPSHVLVPWPPEWRWGFGPGGSRWFPGSPVYRQTVQGDWQPALQAVGAELLR